MLLLDFLNFVAGYREVTCPSADALTVVNALRAGELDYWSLKRKPDGELSFCLLNREYRRLREALAPYGVGLHVKRERGLPQLLRRYRKRLGIPVGIFLFLLLSRLSTLYIWEVTVSGNKTLTDAEVIEALEELGVSVGTYIPSVDFYGLCHEFILQNEEVCWISVNMAGTTARVELIERYPKGELEEDGNGTPTNLVASRDGVVERFETASGQTLIQPGEEVKQGQLLISGVTEVGQEGGFALVRSRGRVFARTERSFSVTVPEKTVKKTFYQAKEVSKSLKFFGKTIKLKENSSILPPGCDIIEDRRRLVLFEGNPWGGGIPLPLYLITGYYEEYREREVTLSQEEALTVARLEMAELVEKELSGADILSREESVTVAENGDVTLTLAVVCVENIAEEIPIGIA